MFTDRKLIIATKHQKEKVIAPLLEKALGVRCFTNTDFNSDILGTFTGEIERPDDPITTARNKCMMAMEMSKCDLAIASEGSFSVHPYLFFIYADEEILMLKDKKNDLEIIVKELSTKTNFDGRHIKTEQELVEFANAVHFPSHGVILRKAKDDFTTIEKGITDWKRLVSFFNFINQKFGTAYIETDMRAMYNPTRMNVIEIATKKLIDKIASVCPHCNAPGFGITEAKQGLPCKLCEFPTQSTLSYIYTCQKCLFQKEQRHPHGKVNEEPLYCDFCNP